MSYNATLQDCTIPSGETFVLDQAACGAGPKDMVFNDNGVALTPGGNVDFSCSNAGVLSASGGIIDAAVTQTDCGE